MPLTNNLFGRLTDLALQALGERKYGLGLDENPAINVGADENVVEGSFRFESQ